MSIIEAIILGLVQGLTEFLPVSSSGHLEIMKSVFSLEFAGKSGLAIDVVVHGGSALAILIFFIKEFIGVGTQKNTKILASPNFKKSSLLKQNLRSIFSLSFISSAIIATLPALLAYILFKKEIEKIFEGSLFVIVICLLITGLFLIFIDFISKIRTKGLLKNSSNNEQTKENSESQLPFMNIKSNNLLKCWLQALIIGMHQAFAILPGISRSGFTFGSGILLGIDRSKAVKFSFLLGFIAITGAVVLKFKDIQNLAEEISVANVLAAFVASFVSSYFALRLILFVVKSRKLKYFGIYCIILSIITAISIF